MTWDSKVWFCEAEYLSAKYQASLYQGNWLIIQDPIEIVLHWYSDGLTRHVKRHAELYDKLRPEEDRAKHLEAHGKIATMPIMGNEFYVFWDKESNFKEN